MPIKNVSREERERELRSLWKSRGGQQEVLRLFRRALPDGAQLKAGDCVFQTILDEEFGVSDEADDR